jgi:hypothetical protein
LPPPTATRSSTASHIGLAVRSSVLTTVIPSPLQDIRFPAAADAQAKSILSRPGNG